jgi:hypothetical protein
MQDVLGACASSTDAVVSVAELITRRVSGGTALSVARASGLVELSGASFRPRPDSHTFTEPRKTAEQHRAMAESAQEYRSVRRFRLKMGFEPPKNRAEYRAEYLARSLRGEVRAQYVLITERGRLTVAHDRKLTCRRMKRA